jgi:hypothetical protein
MSANLNSSNFRCSWIFPLILSLVTSHQSSFSSLKFPEFRVTPFTTLDDSHLEEFAITGFAVDNQQDHLWWRWFMPSFAERHLHGLNLTVKHQINEKFLCHIRMIGMMSVSHVSYEPSGYGLLNIPLLSTPIYNLDCYYSFISRSPRVAIYCPVLNTTHASFSPSSSESLTSDHEMCSQFMAHKERFLVNVTLFPSIYPHTAGKNSPPPSPLSSIHATSAVSTKGISITSSVITIRDQERNEFSPVPPFKSPHHSSHRIAFTVQVFSNTVSEAHLHIFLQHYGRLDFTIVMFDRFGLHYEIVKKYTHLYDIRYHPYTLLQVIQPHIYNDTYKAHLVSLTLGPADCVLE